MIEPMQCKNSKNTEIKHMAEYDNCFTDVRKFNSRINENVLGYGILCSARNAYYFAFFP